jgi:hypothetical protein
MDYIVQNEARRRGDCSGLTLSYPPLANPRFLKYDHVHDVGSDAKALKSVAKSGHAVHVLAT